MTKLLMLQGLPGSGKTTLAKSLEQEGWIRVNKDEIRAELEKTGWVWSRDNEQKVVAIRDIKIAQALEDSKNCVSDDTNFGRKHKVQLSSLAQTGGAEFELRRIDLPVKTCLERNALREGKARVPNSVIWDMFNKFVAQDPEHYPLSAPPRDYGGDKVEIVAGLPYCVLVDLDGTMALFEGKRSPYDASKCEDDDLNFPVAETVRSMKSSGYQPIFLSGREEIYREPTLKFLKKNGFDEPLFMRKAGDFRKDWIIKWELLKANVVGKYNILFALDDRDQVVASYRARGIVVFQVAPGDF